MTSPYANKKFIVDTNQAPRAIGPFSQAVGYAGMLFISGQMPIDPATGEVLQGGVEAQARRVMNNLQAVLMAAGLDFSHVLKTTVYLRNMNDFQLVNDVYGQFFDHSPPARTCVEVSRLPRDVLVSIDAVAAAPTDYAARIEDEVEQNEHLGPDDWEEKHKAESAAVHDTTLNVEVPPASPEEEGGAGEDDAPPAPTAKEVDPFATRELSDEDLEQPSSPPPLAGLKIPKPRSGDD